MKTFLKIFLVLFFLIIIDTINAQSTTWQRVFELEADAQGNRGIQTLDGGYLILGQREVVTGYPYRTNVIKLDKFGNLIWIKNYSVGTYNAVEEDNDSGFILVGDGLLKINSNGDSILYKTYGGSFIKKYYDGGYIISGGRRVVRVDKNLNIIWANNYYDRIYTYITTLEIIFDPNNNIVITLFGENSQQADGGILKLNPDGNPYLKKFDTTAQIRDSYNYITKINDKYAISGGVHSFFQDSISSLYCLLDTNGNLLYRKYYYDSPSFYAHLTNAGGSNLALGGHNFDFVNSEIKMGIRKIDYMGNIIWTRIIKNALNISAPSSMSSTLDGGYLLPGNYENIPTNHFSIYIIKTDSNAYVDPLGVSNQNVQIPDRFMLHPAYPNPFNNSTKIKYEIKQSGYYKMEIYDINGKLISLIFSERLNSGFYEKNLSSYFNQLPSSIYFIRLSDNTLFNTQKIVLIK